MRIRFRLTFLILILCFPACIASNVVGEPTPTMSLRPSQTVALASPTATAIPPSATDTPEVPTATYTNTPEPTALSLPGRLSSLRVAFNSNDQLWLWQNDALVFLSETSVNTDDYFISTNLVVFSEDGTQIAFTKWDDEVWIIRTDGTGGAVVFDHEQLPNTQWEGGSETRPTLLEWQVDPTRILLGRIIWIDTGLYVTAPSLLMADIESGEINEFLASDLQVQYSLSPDGQKIAIIRSHQIEIANQDGSGRRVVFTFPEVKSYETVFIPEIYWHSNSESFSVVLPSPLSGPSLLGPAEVWEIRLDGQAFMAADIDWLPHQTYYLSFSPDLSQFSYKAARDGSPAGFEIKVYSVPMQQSETVYPTSMELGYWPTKIVSWSPSGSRLIILSPEGENNLTVVDLEENDSFTLMENLHIFQAKWIDPESILIVSEEGIHVWEITQSKPVLLIEHEGWERFDAIDFFLPTDN